MDKVLFEETQRSKILIAFAVIAALFFGVLSVVQIGFNHAIGNHPAPGWLLLLFFAGSLAGTVFFYFQKLKLRITADRIQVSFGVLTATTVIQAGDIKTIKLRKYNAMKEFMGWGVRYNGNERCFTVSGDDGLEIELANNNKILIGTQQPERLRTIIDGYLGRP